MKSACGRVPDLPEGAAGLSGRVVELRDTDRRSIAHLYLSFRFEVWRSRPFTKPSRGWFLDVQAVHDEGIFGSPSDCWQYDESGLSEQIGDLAEGRFRILGTYYHASILSEEASAQLIAQHGWPWDC